MEKKIFLNNKNYNNLNSNQYDIENNNNNNKIENGISINYKNNNNNNDLIKNENKIEIDNLNKELELTKNKLEFSNTNNLILQNQINCFKEEFSNIRFEMTNKSDKINELKSKILDLEKELMYKKNSKLLNQTKEKLEKY